MTDIDATSLAIGAHYDSQLPPGAEDDPWEPELPRLSGPPGAVAMARAAWRRMRDELEGDEILDQFERYFGLPDNADHRDLDVAYDAFMGVVSAAVLELSHVDDTDWLLRHRDLGGADLVRALYERRWDRLRGLSR